MLDPRSQFGPVAESYLTSAVHSNPDALDRMIEVVQPKGGTVVDVATGAGHTAYAFAPYVDRVIATDITQQMLDVTKKTAEERGLSNVETQIAKAEDLPFDDESIDGVTCRMGAHHFDNVLAFLREAHRITKPGGWLLIVDTIGDEDDGVDDQVDLLERLRDPSHRRNLKPSAWVQEVEHAGFKVQHTEQTTKDIEIESWMARMRVPADDRTKLQQMLATASGGFQRYLEPFEREGKKYFHLHEMLLFARKS